MTFEEYASSVDDRVKELKSGFSMPDFRLTKSEIALLDALPASVASEVDDVLSAVNPRGDDVRHDVVMKALAAAMRMIPEWERWALAGYSVAGGSHAV